MTKPDRLARSLPARTNADELAPAGESEHRRLCLRPERRGRRIAVQRAGHARRVRVRPDPAAQSKGMKVAKAKGRLCGKQPKLNTRREAHLVRVEQHRRALRCRAGRPVRRLVLDGLSRTRAQQGARRLTGNGSSRNPHLCGTALPNRAPAVVPPTGSRSPGGMSPLAVRVVRSSTVAYSQTTPSRGQPELAVTPSEAATSVGSDTLPPSGATGG